MSHGTVCMVNGEYFQDKEGFRRAVEKIISEKGARDLSYSMYDIISKYNTLIRRTNAVISEANTLKMDIIALSNELDYKEDASDG